MTEPANVPAASASLADASIDELQGRLRGTLLRPSDSEYDEARAIWNGMVDRRPALIARCEGASDVMATLAFARKHGVAFTVRAGGHNVAGRALCDGIVIDLTRMNGVRVDPRTKRAWVEGGATLRDLDVESQAFGLATTGGIHPTTGVAGLTLGGGLGILSRKLGLAADNVVAFEVVLADGSFVRASEDEHADLYWALKGGGGAFGIVTSFEFELHEVGPEVMVAQLFYRHEDAAAALRAYRDFMTNAPDEVGCFGLFVQVPPVAPFPEDQHGRPSIALVACYAGDLDEGRDALEPLASFGDPMLRVLDPMPYAVLQSAFAAGSPDGARYYFKSQFMDELTDEAIDTIAEWTASLPGELTQGGFETMGGAINRVASDATPWPHRDAAFNFSIFAGWTDAEHDEEHIAWAKRFHRAIEPYASDRVYVNYLDGDEKDRVREAFGPNLERLLEVKRRYDPDNVFRVGQALAAVLDAQ